MADIERLRILKEKESLLVDGKKDNLLLFLSLLVTNEVSFKLLLFFLNLLENKIDSMFFPLIAILLYILLFSFIAVKKILLLIELSEEIAEYFLSAL